MIDPQLESYEQIPYDSKPFFSSHPGSLATMGALFGMQPPPVDRCRVLELGCGTGANLIPMALTLPDSQFVGIDLSPGQIDMGRQMVETIGLENIVLRPLSILEVDETYGQFDYILCHGVYSWVPPVVQDKILQICKQNLSSQGMVYVSYNTYPGWHVRGMVREMMYFHVRKVTEPRERVRQARNFLDFLVNSIPDPNTTYGLLLKEESLLLKEQTDSYLFHEHLEAVNHPLYFHEFVARAREKGLRYVAEASFSAQAANLSAEVQNSIEDWSEDSIDQNEYLDFLCNRTFRRSLLCHDNIEPNSGPDPRAIRGLSVASFVRPVTANVDILSDAEVTFRGPETTTCTTNNPYLKAALVSLSEVYPRAIPFEDLRQRVVTRLQRTAAAEPGSSEEQGQLLEPLLHCFIADLVELHIHAPRFVLEISTRPVGSPLARLQAAKSELVTNLCHRMVELNGLDRAVLQRLDGTQDRAALLGLLTNQATADVLTIRYEEKPVEDPDKLQQILGAMLNECLLRLAVSALLMA